MERKLRLRTIMLISDSGHEDIMIISKPVRNSEGIDVCRPQVLMIVNERILALIGEICESSCF